MSILIAVHSHCKYTMTRIILIWRITRCERVRYSWVWLYLYFLFSKVKNVALKWLDVVSPLHFLYWHLHIADSGES